VGGIVKMMCRVAPYGALFSCQEEHDNYLIGRINQMVSRDDELIIIGDFAFDKPGKYRSRIDCKHVKLVLGNHDRIEKSLNVFGQCPEILRTRAYNKAKNDYVKLYLCHYPTMYWDGSHRGWGHLYGHCHGQREQYLDDLEPQRRAMDVGVDNIYRLYGDYRPLAEWEVYDYMARRGGHDDVRFYHDYQQELYIERGFYDELS
jgi:calcineurin-like phosphoesterase family protein